MARVTPYLKKYPNDLILSDDWNEIQTCAREEIQSHTHQGGEDGTLIPREGIQPNAIDGTRIDPASKVTVAQLKVNDRELLADIDSLISRADAFDSRFNTLEARLTTLETGKVNRSGDTIQGDLEVKGHIRGTMTKPLGEQLVHRRILFGYAGDAPRWFSGSNDVIRPFVRGAFEAPPVQPKATRRYRLHALVWVDPSVPLTIKTQWFMVSFQSLTNPAVSAAFSWMKGPGAGPGNPASPDYEMSDWRGVPSGSLGESKLTMRLTQDDMRGVLYYLELQAWDFF